MRARPPRERAGSAPPEPPAPEAIVFPTARALATAVASRLIHRLARAQGERGEASWVLTGGPVGIACAAAVAVDAGRFAVDWSRVDLWWSDERFLPGGDPLRNETQARQACLDRLPLDEGRVRPIPGPGGPWGADPEGAAEEYARILDAASGPGVPLPRFDVMWLGVGDDGHVGSLPPGSPLLHDTRTAVGLRDFPWEPRPRVTLTLPSMSWADEVWMIVAGDHKADLVARALAGADPDALPAAGVHGRHGTLWLLDAEAASLLPRRARRGALPV